MADASQLFHEHSIPVKSKPEINKKTVTTNCFWVVRVGWRFVGPLVVAGRFNEKSFPLTISDGSAMQAHLETTDWLKMPTIFAPRIWTARLLTFLSRTWLVLGTRAHRGVQNYTAANWSELETECLNNVNKIWLKNPKLQACIQTEKHSKVQNNFDSLKRIFFIICIWILLVCVFLLAK